jgi:dihydroxyacetone kinase
MKKLINKPEDVLADALKGVEAAHPTTAPSPRSPARWR